MGIFLNLFLSVLWARMFDTIGTVKTQKCYLEYIFLNSIYCIIEDFEAAQIACQIQLATNGWTNLIVLPTF